MTSRRELLPALTPLRFPAAFAAALFHVWGLLHGPNGRFPPLAAWHLWAGLSFFFVLSGFILTYNYLDEFRRPTRRAVWNFLVARWARTYPVYALALLVIFPIDYGKLVDGAFGNPYTLVATHIFLGQAFIPLETIRAYVFNGPSWSLSAEWFLYLLLPLLIPALTRGPRWWRGAVVLLALAPWGMAVAGMFGPSPLGPGSPYRFPPVRLAEFLAGVLLGMLWHHRHGAGVPATQSVRRATAVEVAVLVLTAAWIYALVVLIRSPKWLEATGWSGVYTPPFLALIWVLARGGGWVSKALASRVPTYLGDISFAFYMLHQPVLSYFYFDGHRIGAQSWFWVWKWVAVLGTSFAISAAVYHLYELPLRDWLRRRLTIRKPKAAAPPDAAPAEPPARRAA